MEEKYYINGNKKYGRTWAELLQSCYDGINRSTEKVWNWKEGWHYLPKVKAYDHARFNAYFKDYRHNDNDWAYWTDGKYERVFVGYTEDRKEKIYINGAWIPPTYVVPTKGWYVEDSFGRIIPSGAIKAALKDFKPFVAEESIWRRYTSTWYNKLYNHDRDFRKGPVPGRGGHRRWSGHWRKYKGDHGGFGMEARSSMSFKHDLKYDEDLYGFKIKFNRSRAKWVELALTDWDDLHWHNKGRGWKRTRKEKQWM